MTANYSTKRGQATKFTSVGRDCSFFSFGNGVLGGPPVKAEKQQSSSAFFFFTFMKHKLQFLFLIFFLPTTLLAEDGDIFTAETIEGVDMRFQVISESEKTCKVYGYFDSPAISKSTEGELTIPEVVKGYSVMSINAYSFYECRGLTLITIPNSVTTIGKDAFENCSGLTSMIIPNSVTSIDDDTFSGCIGLTSVTIPNSVTSIDRYAFRYCRGLTTLVIPNSVTYIGDYAFSGCSGLTSVIIPESVRNIGGGAFWGCSGLTSVVIPESMTNFGIGNKAFEGCSGLTSPICNSTLFVKFPTSYSGDYTIPEGIKNINRAAFSGCHGLTSVTIPTSVISIGREAFYGCIGLTSAIIGNGVTNIDDQAFYDCRELTSVVIGDSVTTIGNEAFAWCRCLTSVTIPNSVTSIGNNAFYECRGLTFVTIPNSVTTIGNYAFYKCSALTSATIGNSVTSIGNEAFLGCSSLSHMTIGNSVNTIGERAFFSCDSLFPVTITASSISISNKVFVEGDSVSMIQLGEEEVRGQDAVFMGLEPEKTYNVAVVYPLYTIWTKSYKTKDLELKTSIPKVTKSGTAIVAAETNLGEEETNAGFEWRKTDAPDDMPSRNGVGVIYDGTMEAVVKNLDASSYYRVRPFYKSNVGNEYYGEWVAFDPSDFSYCEPAIHTYANTKVEGNEVQLTGYVMEGTDDILEQGFEVWVIIFTDGSKTRRAETKGEVMTVPATGQRMTATLSGLEYGTTYAYRSYVKTSSQTYYGEEITFKTGENPNGIEDVIAEESVSPQSIRHGVYTLQGVKVADESTDLKALPQGIYIVNGKKVYVK